MPAILLFQEQPAGGFDGLRLAQPLLGERRAHHRDEAADLMQRLRLSFTQRRSDLGDELAGGGLYVFAHTRIVQLEGVGVKQVLGNLAGAVLFNS